LCAVLQHPDLVTQALERARSGAWVPEELRRRQAALRQVRASVTRQRQRLLEAYLAEVIDLAAFQRQDRTLDQQEADLLAREREVAARGAAGRAERDRPVDDSGGRAAPGGP
jgi:site-specific DNA recombinase